MSGTSCSTPIDKLSAVHEEREIVLEGHGHCSLVGDEHRLNQLFSNLVANAIAHGTANTRITARIVRCDQDAVIEVHNQGTIPREVMGTLFEPFAPSDGASRRAWAWASTSRSRSRTHTAAIEVASSEEQGTVFTVRLPRHAIAA